MTISILRKYMVRLVTGLGAALLLVSTIRAAEPEELLPLSVPVSINALMVTLIDHSAHYIWDYANDGRVMGDLQWQAIEYYAIQLAAAGPLITLGGTGPADNAWADTPRWRAYSRQMMNAAEMAIDAGRLQDAVLLDTAADLLVDSCEGCHQVFKPDLPTEGLTHEPYYDDLYHLFLGNSP